MKNENENENEKEKENEKILPKLMILPTKTLGVHPVRWMNTPLHVLGNLPLGSIHSPDGVSTQCREEKNEVDKLDL